MESYSRRLDRIRRLSYRIAAVAVTALILLFVDWLYLASTGTGGGLLLGHAPLDVNAIDVFDYTESNGKATVEFGSLDSAQLSGFTATGQDGTPVFTKASYLLALRYETPKWANTHTSKFAWVDVSGFGIATLDPQDLPPQLLPLARELAEEQEPEVRAELLDAINESLADKTNVLGLVHNLIATMLLATAVIGFVAFVYVFNMSRG